MYWRVVGGQHHACIVVEHNSDAVVWQLEAEAVFVGVVNPLRYVEDPRPVNLCHGCVCTREHEINVTYQSEKDNSKRSIITLTCHLYCCQEHYFLISRQLWLTTTNFAYSFNEYAKLVVLFCKKATSSFPKTQPETSTVEMNKKQLSKITNAPIKA